MSKRLSSGMRTLVTTAVLLGVACGGRSELDVGAPTDLGGRSGFGASGGVGGSAAGKAGSTSGGNGFGGDAGAGGVGAEGGFGGAGVGGGPAGAGGVGGSNQCFDTANSECDLCVCQSCPSQQSACATDAGCSAIFDCLVNSGCTGQACLTVCGPVIQQYGGPFGPSGQILMQLGTCLRTAGCPCIGSGGAGGSGGVGGSGAFGGSAGSGGTFGAGGAIGSGGSATGGSGGTCSTCVSQSCPLMARCFADPTCETSAQCVLQTCGGGGIANFRCVLNCFNGDLRAAIRALYGFGCVVSQCGSSCLAG